MKDLYTPTDNARKALSELGVAVYDEFENARELNTVINELNGTLAGMSEEEANAYKSTIFQIQGLQAFNKMSVTSTEKQEEWAAALADASGEASRQYATMTDNLQGDIDIWHSALDGFKIAISDELTPTIREFVQFGSGSLGKLTKAFETDGISGAMDALGEILSDGLAMVVDILPSMIDAGMQLIGGLIEGIVAAIPLLIEQLPELILQIVNFLTENLPTILEQGSQMIMTLATGILDALPDLVAQLPAIISAVVDGLAQLPGMMIEIGGNIVKGLWEGIKGLAGWIWDQVSGWASSLWNGICWFFGIHSPSTKFAWAGEMMVDGLACSINENGDEAVDAIKGMAGDMEDAMPTELDFPSVNAPEVTPNGAAGTDGSEAAAASGAAPAFAPQISIVVQGSMDEKATEDLKNSLYETVKELFAEFRAVTFVTLEVSVARFYPSPTAVAFAGTNITSHLSPPRSQQRRC